MVRTSANFINTRVNSHMSTRPSKPKIMPLSLYLRGIQSHSPSEKNAIFLSMVPFVIIDETAEEGWRMMRDSLALALPVVDDILLEALPGAGSGVSLRVWYNLCLSKCQELREKGDELIAGNLCLTCAYVAIVARRLATRPRAAVPV